MLHIIMISLYMYYYFLHRVKQIVGFQTEDLIGQQLCDFFHPKELNGYEHTKCRKNCKFLAFM